MVPRDRDPGPALRVLGDARASWSRGSGRSGRGCCGRRGSRCPRRSRASTGRTCASPTAGAATTCSRSTSSAARRTFVFHGPTGRGKTHVATALGIGGDPARMPVRFFQTATLVLQLGKAKRDGSPRQADGRHREGRDARLGRVRLRSVRRGRRPPALPGDIRFVREEEA